MEKKYTKAQLKEAYEAGVSAVGTNSEIDRLLDAGTKQSPEKQSFETWFEAKHEEDQINIRTYNGWQEPNGSIG